MSQRLRCARALGGLVLTAGLLAGVLAGGSVASAQETLLSYDFEDGDLGDFYLPIGVELCGDQLPTGTAMVDDGEVVLTTDNAFGIGMFMLRAEVVEDMLTERDYKMRARIVLETVTQLSASVRSRIGFLEDQDAIDSSLERSYQVSVVLEQVDPLFPDGFLAISEFTACHDQVDHPEWPGGDAGGFAFAVPDFPLVAGEEYWLEIGTLGDDDGGPVTITAAIWPDGDDPPDTPQLAVVDEDGLQHTEETLAPEANAGLFFGLNFDIEPRPFEGMAFIDDVTIVAGEGCSVAPATLTRTLWGDAIAIEGAPTAFYEDGGTYEVTLELSDPRAAGDGCDAAGTVLVTERVPDGWESVEIVSGNATVDGGAIAWTVDLTGDERSLSYRVTAGGTGLARFEGAVSEEGSDFVFSANGPARAVDAAASAPISDFGSIQHWLVLGPFTRVVGGANPGEEEIVKDYLADGEIVESEIQPSAGETIFPDYAGEAASSGLAADAFGRNPDDTPTWIEWRDLDDDDDRIDFEAVYGDVDEVMCYAVTYLEVSDDIVVNFGVSSDDAVHVLLDGETLHLNAVARGAQGRSYQDTPDAFENLRDVDLSAGFHTIVVKVFEGGGDHNFRLGFVDEFGAEIPGGPEEVTVQLASTHVDLRFLRGDSNSDTQFNIADPIFTLNGLFGDGAPSGCRDAEDANDDAAVNIADPIYLLNRLFGTGPPPPPPFPSCDFGVADLGCEASPCQ